MGKTLQLRFCTMKRLNRASTAAAAGVGTGFFACFFLISVLRKGLNGTVDCILNSFERIKLMLKIERIDQILNHGLKTISSEKNRAVKLFQLSCLFL